MRLSRGDAFSGESVAIETKPDELTKLVIKDFSRKKYTVPVEQVEQEINSTYFHWVQEQLVKKAARAKKKSSG